MKRELFTTTTFERDLRRVKRQGKDLAKLEAIANLLQAEWGFLRATARIPSGADGKGTGTVTWSRIGSSSTNSQPAG